MSYELEVVKIRLVKEPSWYSDTPLQTSKDVGEFLSKEFAEYDREVCTIVK